MNFLSFNTMTMSVAVSVVLFILAVSVLLQSAESVLPKARALAHI